MKIARLMLPDADVPTMEDRAFTLMALPVPRLEQALKRLEVARIDPPLDQEGEPDIP